MAEWPPPAARWRATARSTYALANDSGPPHLPLGVPWPTQTPIVQIHGFNLDLATALLCDCPHKAFLMRVLTFGAPSGFEGPFPEKHCEATLVADDDLLAGLDDTIKTDIAAGNLIDITDMPQWHLRPGTIRARWKSQRTKVRKIDDFSQKTRKNGQMVLNGINGGIDTARLPGNCPLANFKDLALAIRACKHAHPTTEVHLDVNDIKDFYKNIPIQYEDCLLFQVEYKKRRYCMTTLPMGARGSPHVATLLSTHLTQGIANKIQLATNSYSKQLVYVDDIIGVAPATTSAEAKQLLRADMEAVGLPMATAERYLKAPSIETEWLGVIHNTHTMTHTLTEARREKVRMLINQFRALVPGARPDTDPLQSLLGHLSNLTQLRPIGKLYMHHLFRAQDTHLWTVGAQKQLQWWATLLEQPVTSAMHEAPKESDAVLHTDASLSGFGMVLQHNGTRAECDVAAGTWRATHKSGNITKLELATVFGAVQRWQHSLQHRNVILYCDNKAVVAMLRRGTCKSPNIRPVLHSLFLFLAQQDIRIYARWIPTEFNTLADQLSRSGQESTLLHLTHVPSIQGTTAETWIAPPPLG